MNQFIFYMRSEGLTDEQHNKMLSMLGCYKQSHPCHHLVDRQPRQVKKNHHEREAQIYKRESLDQLTYQSGLNSIHFDAVTAFIAEYRVNTIFGDHPPHIAAEKREMLRQTRVVLVPLRGGCCSRLKLY